MSFASSTASAPAAPNTDIHERDIPGIVTQGHTAQTELCYTELSFCLPTSLAFAKRSSWEQTPWIPISTSHRTTNPISNDEAHLITIYLASHLGSSITPEAVQNALLFGTMCPSPVSAQSLGTYPHIFIVFPHAPSRPALDEKFLKIWHDQIVKPAFDRAWKDSGLTSIHGAEQDGLSRVLPPQGTSTARDALPAHGFLKHLRNGTPASVRDFWPAWHDPWGSRLRRSVRCYPSTHL